MFNRRKKNKLAKILGTAAVVKTVPKKPLIGSLGGLAAMVAGIFAYKKYRANRSPA